ncbi:MAG: caspase family protein, partial [Chitinophagaceae bacterium]
MLFRRFFLLLALAGIAACAAAQPTERGIAPSKTAAPVKGNTYAIIVGISDYKQVSKLRYAHRDAQAFEDYLLSEAGGRVPKANVETFLNERATRSNIADAISQVIRKAGQGDRVYFFFAGHGDMEDYTQVENGLLLLYDSPNGNYFGMNDDVLQILDLKRYLSALPERKGADVLFIIDACHAGNLAGGVQGSKQTGAALLASWGKEFKILSCQPNQLSVEDTVWGGGRGLFSYVFEEAVKGMADEDGNGEVSVFELESYLKSNVAKFSERRQIPVVTGDPERSFFRVNPPTLAALRKLKEQNVPMLATTKGRAVGGPSPDSLNPAARRIYDDFQRRLSGRALVWPLDTNALRDYRTFSKLEPNSELTAEMRRALAAALNIRFNDIVAPQLRGETSISTKDECYYAAMELDSCLGLLGNDHYLYANLQARKLYMDAMALTWAINEDEYNVGQQGTVEEAIQLLEQSARLESNVAYTYSALGMLYYLLNDFD